MCVYNEHMAVPGFGFWSPNSPSGDLSWGWTRSLFMHSTTVDRQDIEMRPYLTQLPKNAQPRAMLFKYIDHPPNLKWSPPLLLAIHKKLEHSICLLILYAGLSSPNRIPSYIPKLFSNWSSFLYCWWVPRPPRFFITNRAIRTARSSNHCSMLSTILIFANAKRKGA